MSFFDINSTDFEKDYLTVLDAETVDALDGSILSPGQTVIRSPYNHALVVADSPDNRQHFVDWGFVWDEPTRVKRVKEEVDMLLKFESYGGSVRSKDVARPLKMDVAVVENILESLVQTQDYDWGESVTDLNGTSCRVITKRIKEN